jgi:hypothetical protein
VRRRHAWALPVALAALGACATPQPATVRGHVATLASERMQGRLAGSEGERRAADYLVAELERLGARPLPGRSDLRVPFDFAAGARDAGTALEWTRAGERERWAGPEQVRALGFASAGLVSGGVVFAGYGLRAPGHDADSYAGLDATGKIALVLTGFPQDAAEQRRAELARYAGLRYKALVAREAGAIGLLVVQGPRSPSPGETLELGFDASSADSGIVAASVGGEVAARLLAARPGFDLTAFQARLDAEDPHAAGFELAGTELTLDVRLEHERRRAANVAGVLPAASGAGPPYVVLGAHYDHLGLGTAGTSLAREGERGKAHLGADDNASGVAAVLEIGRALATRGAGRPVVLALWSAEELGLLGSRAFVDAGILAPGDVSAYLNFDMVGRLRENRLSLQGVGSSPIWPRLIERANVAAGFDLRLQDDPFLPTDSASFDRKQIPTLSFFTGAHTDYHRPTDRADRIDYEGLERIASFATEIALALASEPERPAWVAVAPSGPSPGRALVSAYTGTIPDYASDTPGLALAGVVTGGPAEQAGLRAGDVIVRFGSHEIRNIYDYTYALGGARIGEPVRVRYLRQGEAREATLTPRARP